jgi:hypothetical protein
MSDVIACPCLSATDNIEYERDADGNIPLEAFIAMRARCSALKKILIPEGIWREHLQWHQKGDEVASLASAVLLAFIRGVLHRITSPVHSYLMAGDEIAAHSTRQYVRDLKEKWMFHPDPVTRNRLFRTFRGRYTELQVAAWLEDRGHFITGMEALRPGPDIETASPEGQSAYEVKCLGQSDGTSWSCSEPCRTDRQVAEYRPTNRSTIFYCGSMKQPGSCAVR